MELSRRLERILALQKQLTTWNVEAVCIESPIDLYYLTGLDLSKGRLFVSNKEVNLFVDGRYFTYASEKAPCKVHPLEKGDVSISQQVGFDAAATTVLEYKALSKAFPQTNWIELPGLLRDFRAIKDLEEIQALKKAALLTYQGIEHMRNALRVGITEREVAWEFEQFVRMRGASHLAFDTIVAFGSHSALPHHRPSDKRLEKDQIVLFDAGAVVSQYAGDATRVYFFGNVDAKLIRIYGWVKEAHLAAKAAACVGRSTKEPDEAARAIFRREGVEDQYVHSLGHGVGLETHEFPYLKSRGSQEAPLLQKQMVFTIEPGLYFPHLGGVRLEDTGVLLSDGFESFYPELEEHPMIR